VELTRDTARLAAMANAGGGKYMDMLDAPSLFKELQGLGKQRPVEGSYILWSSYWTLALIVILLSSEWLIRKRLGMN
jgi:hypothetical protein